MTKWPEELIRFLQRLVPVFIHLAAVEKGAAPFICRGYGFRLEFESERLWIYILKSQWLRLTEYKEHQGELSALLTSGVDNESYQFKGRYTDIRPLAKEDACLLEEQCKWASMHTPGLLPMIQVTPSECLAVGFRIKAVFLQTPGPGAGSLVMERSGE